MTRIKELREAKRLTQEQLAEVFGFDRSTVTKWESGDSNPRSKDLPKLARVLGVTIDELLKEAE